jgi:hypothetical protein
MNKPMSTELTDLPAAPTPQELYRFDPARKPDSRFQRVLELVNHHPRALRCKAWDDEAVREMRKYMLGRRVRSARQRKLLASQFHAQSSALEIFERADPELRLCIECAILAGLSDSEIAYRLDLSVKTVVTYEKVFFDIRDRLKYRLWIHSAVLDSSRRKGMTEVERLMKAHAFAAGPAGVDGLLTSDPTRRDKYRRVADLVDKFNAAVANEYTVSQKAELDRFIRAEKQAEYAAAATRNAIVAAARRTLIAIKNAD